MLQSTKSFYFSSFKESFSNFKLSTAEKRIENVKAYLKIEYFIGKVNLFCDAKVFNS